MDNDRQAALREFCSLNFDELVDDGAAILSADDEELIAAIEDGAALSVEDEELIAAIEDFERRCPGNSMPLVVAACRKIIDGAGDIELSAPPPSRETPITDRYLKIYSRPGAGRR